MADEVKGSTSIASIKKLPRNIWAVGFTSMFMDISSEMVLNILPLFLSNVLGVQTSIIGLIDGIAEATASILKMFSGWLSDRLGGRKWLAVAGYGLSALVKPFFYFANTWGLVAGVRWADRSSGSISSSRLHQRAAPERSPLPSQRWARARSTSRRVRSTAARRGRAKSA